LILIIKTSKISLKANLSIVALILLLLIPPIGIIISLAYLKNNNVGNIYKKCRKCEKIYFGSYIKCPDCGINLDEKI